MPTLQELQIGGRVLDPTTGKQYLKTASGFQHISDVATLQELEKKGLVKNIQEQNAYIEAPMAQLGQVGAPITFADIQAGKLPSITQPGAPVAPVAPTVPGAIPPPVIPGAPATPPPVALPPVVPGGQAQPSGASGRLPNETAEQYLQRVDPVSLRNFKSMNPNLEFSEGELKNYLTYGPISPSTISTNPKDYEKEKNASGGWDIFDKKTGQGISEKEFYGPGGAGTQMDANLIPERAPKVAPTAEDFAKMTPEQQTVAINDFVKKAAESGMSYSDIKNYIEAMTSSTTSEKQKREEIYKNYGITDLEAKVFAPPEQSFEDVYKKAYADAGLEDYKTKMQEVSDKIAKAEESHAKVVGGINDETWLTEGSRVARVNRENQRYQAEANSLQSQYDRLESNFNRGKETAMNLAGKVYDEITGGQKMEADKLDYYTKRAEADVAVEITEGKTKEEKELMKYFPEFAKSMPTKAVKAETISGPGGSQYERQKDGTWKQIVAPKWAPKTTTTPDYSKITSALYNVGIPTNVSDTKGNLLKSYQDKLVSAGIPLEGALDLWNEIKSGTPLEEIRQLFKENGIDPLALDIFMQVLQGTYNKKEKSSGGSPIEGLD